MTVEEVKTPHKSEALEVLERYLASGEPHFAELTRPGGEYGVRIIRPSHTAVDSEPAEMPDSFHLR